jgi:hypothetical protein
MFLVNNISNISIPPEGGLYWWYITKEGADKLGLSIDNCLCKDGLFLIYIGISNNLKRRLGYHIKGNVSNSSFRKTISKYLGQINESEISNCLDKYFKFEFEVNPSYKTLEPILIKEYNPSFNIQNIYK